MKISPLNNIILPRRRYQSRPAAPSFQSSDTVEFSSSVLPKKLELTEFEAKYNDVMVQVKRLDSNIYVQKNNLKDYYSAQDKYDYQELLKQRQNLRARLRNMAKKSNNNQFDLEYNITVKKEYNRFAPKIYKAGTKPELRVIEKLINEYALYPKTKELLLTLIGQRIKTLKFKIG